MNPDQNNIQQQNPVVLFQVTWNGHCVTFYVVTYLLLLIPLENTYVFVLSCYLKNLY